MRQLCFPPYPPLQSQKKTKTLRITMPPRKHVFSDSALFLLPLLFFSLPFPLSTKPPAPHPKIWSKYICPSRSKPVWEVSLAHTLPRAGARDASAFKSRKGMYLHFSNSGSYGRQIILNYFQPKGTFRRGNGVITKKTAWNPFSNPKLVILGDFLAKRIWQI